MTGTDAGSITTVKVLVRQQQVPPVRIGLPDGLTSMGGSPAFILSADNPGELPADFEGRGMGSHGFFNQGVPTPATNASAGSQ
jgi:hypothetical protein